MTAAQRSSSARPFALRDKVSYALGDMGNDLTFVLVGTYFLIFATNVVGVQPGVAGALLLLARLVDAFSDVAMGRVVDLLPSAPDGKYRPWLRRMTGPVAVLAVLCFLPVLRSWPPVVSVVWLGGAYLIYGIAYSAINIPYGSMATVISPSPHDRASLSVFRSIGAMIGGAATMALSYIVYYRHPATGYQVLDARRMFLAALICAVLAVVCHLVCYRGSVERVTIEQPPRDRRRSFVQVLQAMARNRALLAIIVASLVLVIAIATLQSLQAYLWLDYFGDGRLQLWGGIALVAPALLLAPFAGSLARHVGKRESAIVGMLAGAAVGVLAWLLRLHDPLAFLTLSVIAGLGAGVFNLLIWAMITDVIDFQELQTGERDNGTVYATYNWARKLGQALAGGLTGLLLSLIGYRVSHGHHVQQSPATLDGIYTLATLGSGLMFGLMALVLIFWYPLGRQHVIDNAEALAARHAERPAASSE